MLDCENKKHPWHWWQQCTESPEDAGALKSRMELTCTPIKVTDHRTRKYMALAKQTFHCEGLASYQMCLALIKNEFLREDPVHETAKTQCLTCTRHCKDSAQRVDRARAQCCSKRSR